MIDRANEEAERLKNEIRRGKIGNKIKRLRDSKKSQKGNPVLMDPDVETIQSIYKKGIASLAASSRLRLPIEDDVVSTLEGL